MVLDPLLLQDHHLSGLMWAFDAFQLFQLRKKKSKNDDAPSLMQDTSDPSPVSGLPSIVANEKVSNAHSIQSVV
jgi:hypothetical protein